MIAGCRYGRAADIERALLAERYEIATQRGARTMTLDPKTHRLYFSTAEFGPSPAPTPERPNPRPAALPGSFMVLVLAK